MRYVWPILLLTLTACGFRPMYGAATPADSGKAEIVELTSVEVNTQPDRLGQLLKSGIEDRLNPDARKSSSRYLLQADVAVSSAPIGISPDGTISRYNLVITSNYSLHDKTTGVLMTRGVVRRTGSYNNPSNAYYSTIVAEQDSTERVIVEVAEEYRMRLAAYFANPTLPPPEVKPNNNPIDLNETLPKIR